MKPFEFVLLFVSFIYSLAIAHLLMGVARMVRRRRELIFSLPHALWMVVALFTVMFNWLAFWDFHAQAAIDIGEFAATMLICVVNYLVAALVTPEFETRRDDDLRRFHKEQGRTYLSAILGLIILAVAINTAAELEGVTRWGEQNWLVLSMAVPVLAALFMRQPPVQLLAPAVVAGLFVWDAAAYYPKLA